MAAETPEFGLEWMESRTSLETHAEAEPQGKDLSSRLNWLRAGVLGANDGIVSVAAIVVGVAGVNTTPGPILTAGMAGLVGGAVSMALGEYVSVSSQSDSQRPVIKRKRRELAEQPGEKLSELAGAYRRKGLSEATARRVAEELTEKNALDAHLAVDLHSDEDEIVNPWHAAFASAISFTLGAVLPLLAILLPPEAWRVPITFASVLVALPCGTAPWGNRGSLSKPAQQRGIVQPAALKEAIPRHRRRPPKLTAF